jgi:predicted nucleic acid-binding protein
MNVLIDTNIVVDVLTRREPFFDNSQMVLLLSEHRYIDGFVSATAITDIFYITGKLIKSKKIAKDLLNKLINMVSIASVNGDIVTEALEAEWDDFEDSIQYAVGKKIMADYIVTRNAKDFSGSKILVVEPEELLDKIAP